MPKPFRKELTAARVRELLDYDPVTGSLTWTDPTDRNPSEGGNAGALGRSGTKYQFKRFIQIDYKRYPAHRLAWLHYYGVWPDGFLIPKNDDFDDLRIENFTDADASAMARRASKVRTNTSGYRGVTWAKDKNRWLAYITHKYKRVHVGYFKTIEEAIEARNRAAADLESLPIHDKDRIEQEARARTRDARLRVQWRKLQKQTYGVTRWASFEQFARDIGELPEANGQKMILIPVDPELPIGPGNFQWHTPESRWDYSTPEGKKAYAQAHRDQNRNSYRDKSLRASFGISLAEYEEMLASQGNVCGACGGAETDTHYGKLRRMAVDHCHTSGRIRGILCGSCNKGIGHFKDDPVLLRKAADYLERHAMKSSNGAASPETRTEERKAHHGNYSS